MKMRMCVLEELSVEVSSCCLLLSNRKEKKWYYLSFNSLCFNCSMLVQVLGEKFGTSLYNKNIFMNFSKIHSNFIVHIWRPIMHKWWHKQSHTKYIVQTLNLLALPGSNEVTRTSNQKWGCRVQDLISALVSYLPK